MIAKNKGKTNGLSRPDTIVLDKISVFFKKSILRQILRILVMPSSTYRTFKIVKNINEQYSIHDFRLVKGPTHMNLIFDVLLPADDEVSHHDIKKQIIGAVQKINKHYFCVIQIDHAFL